MTTQPLDVSSLLPAASPPTESAPAGDRWGHLHLRVTDLARSEAFYRPTLGLVLTQRTYPGARFLAGAATTIISGSIPGVHHGDPSRPAPWDWPRPRSSAPAFPSRPTARIPTKYHCVSYPHRIELPGPERRPAGPGSTSHTWLPARSPRIHATQQAPFALGLTREPAKHLRVTSHRA